MFLSTVKKYKTALLYSALFLLICFLSFCFPLTGDDLTLTLIDADSISKLADYSLNYGNGRYVGNFLVIPLVNSVALRVICKAICFFITFLLMKKLFTNYDFKGGIFTVILLLGMPISIFRQAFVWTAGFQNYFPPVMLFLMCIYIMKKYEETKKFYLLFPLAVLALSEQFFVENSTAFHVIFAIALIVYIVKSKKYIISGAVYSVFTVIGAVLMAIHPKTVLVENYRTNYLKDFGTFFSGIFENYKIIADTLRQGFFLWLLFSLVCFSLLSKSEKITNVYILKAIKAIIGFFPVYCAGELFFLGETYAANNILRTIFGLLMPLIYLFCIVFVIFKCMPDSKRKNTVMVLFALGLCAAAILLPVFPIDSRCVYVSYVCFCAAALLLSKDIELNFNITKCASIVLAALTACYCFVYTDIYYADKMRSDYIAEQKSKHAEVIVISDLPHSQFLHFNYDNVHLTDYYYYYYETPGDLQFIITDWNKWINFIEKEN